MLWSMLIAVSLASASLLWLGLYPATYYIGAFFFVILLWGGIVLGVLLMAASAMFRLESPGPKGAFGLHTSAERAFLIVPLVTTLLLVFHVPLRLAAATAIPALATSVSQPEKGESMEQQQCGLYTMRMPGRRQGSQPDQVHFALADGWGTIVYSRGGSDKITYNPGAKGHLFGDWYWKVDD